MVQPLAELDWRPQGRWFESRTGRDPRSGEPRAEPNESEAQSLSDSIRPALAGLTSDSGESCEIPPFWASGPASDAR